MGRGIVYYRTSVIFSGFLQLFWSSLRALRSVGCGASRQYSGGAGQAVIERTTLDFWDITKLLVRRWQIALPMLLLSVIITAVTMSQVKPDYVSTAYVQLVSPNAGNHEPGAVTPDQQNQWIGLGLSTLGNAAIVQ